MAHSTVNAFDTVRHLDCGGKLNDAPKNKKQKIATGLLRDRLYEQDFAGPISVRASKILGPIIMHLVLDWHLGCCVSSAMGYALPKGSTTTNKSTRVMLDARIDPTLSLPLQ